jgi:hypothetical protein
VDSFSGSMTAEKAWLRERLEELEKIDRPSASEGEREAAEWLVARFAELGAEARIEAEPAHDSYWWPLGTGAALGALGGLAALRGRRALGTLLGAIGAAGIADDFPPGQRRLRRFLPERTTCNVVCELGDPGAEKTIVLIVHHDAAHSGLVFHPKLPQIGDRLGLIERTDTRPRLGGGDGRDRRPPRRPRRQRQRHRRRLPAGAGETAAGRAARGDPRRPALGRLGGVVQRGDQSLRRAPLRRAAEGAHLLPLSGDAGLAAPDFDTVADGIQLAEATIRRLGERWL